MRLKLATKIFIVIIGIEILSVLGSVGTLLNARHLKTLLASTISEAVPSVLAEVELDSSLQRQKGLAAGIRLPRCGRAVLRGWRSYCSEAEAGL